MAYLCYFLVFRGLGFRNSVAENTVVAVNSSGLLGSVICSDDS